MTRQLQKQFAARLWKLSGAVVAPFALALWLFPSCTQAQALPAVPGRDVITVTPDPGYFTEPSIAVNPLNPNQVVAAFQDNAHIAYSTDAGKHWQLASGIAPPDWRVSGDVSVTYDNQGQAIICYMAFDKLGSFNYWAHNSSRNGLHIRRSLDGGQTWETHDIPVILQADEATVPWEDKPYIVADNSNSPYAGNLYIGWTRWNLADSEILLTRSTDDGKTWSKPIEIDSVRGLPRDDNGALEGFAGAVGPDGTLYVVWADGNHIIFTTSHDGGQTFAPTREIIKTAPIMFQVEAVARSNGFPQIAIDPRGGKAGLIFVSWSDYRNGDVDVFCSTSVDQGATWTPAVRVNTDGIHDGADQYFQWLAVDPSDGSANIVFYDRRRDPQNRKQIVVLARSTDGGQTFRNFAWTDDAFDAQSVFMGDYTGLTAWNGKVYGVWTEKPNRPAEQAQRGNQAGQPVSRDNPNYWRLRGTIIRIGLADFGSAEPAAAKH
ncbi:MAG TPA: sialidase family protein [Candidatus Acidoferrales bacterium]|nr:sialidase family protein [Candidatus Acidoferrales bacterium]